MAKAAELGNRAAMETDQAIQSVTGTVAELNAAADVLRGLVARFKL